MNFLIVATVKKFTARPEGPSRLALIKLIKLIKPIKPIRLIELIDAPLRAATRK